MSSSNNFQEEPSKYYVNICRPPSKDKKVAAQERQAEEADGFIHIDADCGLVSQMWEVRVGSDLHTYIELNDPLGWKDVKSMVIPDSKRMFLRAFRLNQMSRDHELHLAFLACIAVQASLVSDGTLESQYRVSKWLEEGGLAPARRLEASVRAVESTRNKKKKATKAPKASTVGHSAPAVAHSAAPDVESDSE